MVHPTLTGEEIAALRAYAKAHGRRWKAHLQDDWLYARTTGALQQLRNRLGPGWLVRFQLDEVPA